MHVLFVIPAYFPARDYGGPVLKLHALASAFHSLGIPTDIWTADYAARKGRVRPGTRYVGGLRVRHFRRLCGYHWSPIVPQSAFAQVPQGVSVAHCMGMRDGMTYFAATAFRRAGVPYLVEPLGMYTPAVRKVGCKKLFDRTVGGPYLNNAAGFVVSSERERAQLGINRDDVWLRYNPLLGGTTVEEPQSICRHELGLPQGPRMVGWIGRICRSKALDLLVTAVAGVPNLHLAVAGPDDGDGAMDILVNSIARLGMNHRVHILGPVWGRRKGQFFASIDAFALPSLTENFGNAAVEAAILGLPVVLSDQCGAADLLSRLGAATAVPSEVRALRDALLAAFASGRTDATRGSAAARLRDELSPVSIARRQLDIYADVLQKKKATIIL